MVQVPIPLDGCEEVQEANEAASAALHRIVNGLDKRHDQRSSDLPAQRRFAALRFSPNYCAVPSSILVSGIPFPKEFQATVKQIFRRMFRVFVHVYFHHNDKLTQIGAVRVRHFFSRCPNCVDIHLIFSAGGPLQYVLQAFLLLCPGVQIDRLQGIGASGSLSCCIFLGSAQVLSS